ncbi:hypothetical protein [Tenacibaculum halocynthiae]|uniref:hypothetical protein n=1 Tax=Tenacibaculum halocynthiae TaxID=1254437 RepID=UPI003D65C92B
MKKTLLNLGKNLSKVEQKEILGGNNPVLPICKCNTVGTIINQPCDGIGTGCGIIDIEVPDICDVFPALC